MCVWGGGGYCLQCLSHPPCMYPLLPNPHTPPPSHPSMVCVPSFRWLSCSTTKLGLPQHLEERWCLLGLMGPQSHQEILLRRSCTLSYVQQ